MIRTITTSTLTKASAPLSNLVFPALAHRTLTQKTHLNVPQDIPYKIFREVLDSKPIPMCEEFATNQKMTTESLESIDFGAGKHRQPMTVGDKGAYYTVKLLRTLPDTYFGKNHYMRAVMLETVAAVPGMVGAMLRHMKSLRNMSEDGGWISHLLHEAENERMHLMTWMKCLKPTVMDRLLVLGAQGIFFNAYFVLYLASPKTAHRMCGYLEEEAVVSYTHFLNDIDNGIIKNGPAPKVAIDYYNLDPGATIRDVVLAVRADEAVHRDANHYLSDCIANQDENILAKMSHNPHDSKHISPSAA